MKGFNIIYREGSNEPYLRQQNPLQSARHLVSAVIYETHEDQYINEAILFLNPIEGKTIYLETELDNCWQFRSNPVEPWEDCGEPSYTGTNANQYRQVFKVKAGTKGVPVSKSFQQRVRAWLISCFSESIIVDKHERSNRFLEEALELVQSTGLTKEEAIRMVIYVYSRPVGEIEQEIGGCMVTLAGLAESFELSMVYSGEIELERIEQRIPETRAKQQTKIKEGIAS
jgi:hypothetical protein